jgi:hypothetical protein
MPPLLESAPARQDGIVPAPALVDGIAHHARKCDKIASDCGIAGRSRLSFSVATDEPPYSDYYRIAEVTPTALPGESRSLVLDDPSDPGAFNRRQLDVVAILELATAIQADEMFVARSLSYDRFWTGCRPKRRIRRR